MKILTAVWKFINSKIFSYIVIAVVIILFVGTCGRNSILREEAVRNEQNLIASKDSIEAERLKNGNLQVSINGYMANEKELKEFKDVGNRKPRRWKGRVVC